MVCGCVLPRATLFYLFSACFLSVLSIGCYPLFDSGDWSHVDFCFLWLVLSSIEFWPLLVLVRHLHPASLSYFYWVSRGWGGAREPAGVGLALDYSTQQLSHTRRRRGKVLLAARGMIAALEGTGSTGWARSSSLVRPSAPARRGS